MKKYFLMTSLMIAFCGLMPPANAGSPERPHSFSANPESEGQLRKEMRKMILSVADMDIMMNETRELDFEILAEDAERILTSIKKIRELDKAGAFKKLLKNLEKPTKKMLVLSQKKDPRAANQTTQIFNSCFSCHDQHRPKGGI